MTGTTLRHVGQARTSSTGPAPQQSRDPDIVTTWDYFLGGQVEAIAISDDGNYVAAVS